MDNGASSYRRYLDGDEDAFAQIVEALFDDLISFIDRYVRDTAAAEDIAIDAFSDLIVHRHRYDFRVSLKTYLFMVGRSRALNYIKRRNRHPSVELTDVLCELPDALSPEDTMIAQQRSEAVTAALKLLRPDQQEAVYLVYYADMSCQEAASVMKKSVKQVYNLLYRAKDSLRTILSKEGEQYL